MYKHVDLYHYQITPKNLYLDEKNLRPSVSYRKLSHEEVKDDSTVETSFVTNRTQIQNVKILDTPELNTERQLLISLAEEAPIINGKVELSIIIAY